MSAIAARQTIELERDPAHIDFQEIRPGPGAGSGLLTRRTITHSSVAGRSRICAVAAIPPTTTNCRYRARKSHNRTRPKGWLPPSVQRRIDTTLATAHRLARYAPVTWIHIEQVAFDTHAMTAGRGLTAAEYRNGTLAGTEIRAYLLATWGRTRAYCGASGLSTPPYPRASGQALGPDASPSAPPGNTASARRWAAAPCPAGTFGHRSVPTDTRTATGRKSPNKWVETFAEGS
ncbi:RRXRR domain-containing protein [Streptomyces sp. NPDC079189]|uniref:RRXRR domain-containing protein n=1 Tax=Streptomyces sp. NPDC079189 TaxID=3154514 RepID=UPI003441288C